MRTVQVNLPVTGLSGTSGMSGSPPTVSAEVAWAVGALVGCGEPAVTETGGALVGDEVGALLELPLIERFFCNQAIWSSVSATARAA
jgi:hypothetical protein